MLIGKNTMTVFRARDCWHQADFFVVMQRRYIEASFLCNRFYRVLGCHSH